MLGILLTIMLVVIHNLYDLPYLELLAIWIFSIPCIIGIDKIFHQMLCIFVKEEVKKGDHDERIIKIISHLIKVENDNKNTIRDSEIRKILCENPQNIYRLQSKKIECILNLLKKEDWLQ